MPLDSRRSHVIKHNKTHAAISILSALVVQGIFHTLIPFVFNRSPPKPMRTSEVSGAEYIYDVMYCGNPRRIQEILRMKLEVFQSLCIELENNTSLSASRFVNIEEKVAIFLWIVARSASNRDTQERFQHSGETISRCFHEVLQAINSLIPKYIKLHSSAEIPIAITSNSKYYNFFNNCIGALDGTHIAAKIPEFQQAAYRNRKGQLSQNVLACCEFDQLLFTYVLSGWEGSAHDGAVLEAAFEAGFSIPSGKYYLGDAGFPLTPWCIVPYRGVRYHLREWGKSNERYQVLTEISTDCRPRNAQELFNLRHSSLRNAIERIFGVLKKRFQILTRPLEFEYEIQVRLVNVLCCLHNIIRMAGGDDNYDIAWKAEMESSQSGQVNDEDSVIRRDITDTQNKQAKAMRDVIATKMWAQYTGNR